MQHARSWRAAQDRERLLAHRGRHQAAKRAPSTLPERSVGALSGGASKARKQALCPGKT